MMHLSLHSVYNNDQSRANVDLLTKSEYEYFQKVKFPIFIFQYPVLRYNIFNIIYKRQFLIEYENEYICKVKFPKFVFEYPISGEKYLNIRIYYKWSPSLMLRQPNFLTKWGQCSLRWSQPWLTQGRGEGPWVKTSSFKFFSFSFISAVPRFFDILKNWKMKDKQF